ncbi:MAG: KH domain-containing protein [Candidatus ainarchaeum sp.]|nr:KH domain-containing protein [Candidatus ainarchaeum sp.]
MEISQDDLGIINLFASICGVIPSDMVREGKNYLFLVEPMMLGKAIGKEGANIKRLRARLGGNVMIAKDAAGEEDFLRGFLNNIQILDIERREAPGQVALFITIPDVQRGIAIGKEGMRIKSLKAIMKKKFGADIFLKTRRTAF